jgi:transcriptional regulator with XRE-family HTH domain
MGAGTSARQNSISNMIGSRIRECRKRMNLTLRELGARTSFSSPLLSKIENGLTLPSIPTLEIIADVLNVELDYFFRKEEKQGYVISRSNKRGNLYQRKSSNENSKICLEYYPLAEGMDNCFMQPTIVTIFARTEEEFTPVTHDGQEFCYVVEGILELTLGDRKIVLRKGDSAYFNCTIPHRVLGLSKKTAKTLSIHLVPGKVSTGMPRQI